MALLIFATGFTSVIAVQGAPEGSALTNANVQGNDNVRINNGVKQVAQIRRPSSAEIKGLQEARIKAMNAYAGIKKEASVVRNDMIQKRESLNKCQNSDDADCVKLEKDARIASGDYLENLANMLIKHLEEVQIKVKLSEEINEEEELKIISLIEERKGRLESVKDEITRLKNGETADIASRQQIVKKLKTEVSDAKVFLRKISLHVEARKIKELIAQQEIASEKIEKTISEMENVDTETLKDLLSIMKADLEEAQKYIVLATEKTDDNVLAVVKEDMMRNYLNRARVEVKESYITLHKMVRILRQGGQEIVDSEISNSAPGITDSAPEITNEGNNVIELNNLESENEEEVLQLSIPIGGTDNAKVDMTPIEGVSCVSLSGSSASALNCDVMDENRHLSFMIEEYETGYAGLNNVEVTVSENAVEGTCFCQLNSYDGETKELTIDVVSEGE